MFLNDLIRNKAFNNETFGLTVQATICDLYNIKEDQFKRRIDSNLKTYLTPLIKNIFEKLEFKPVKCCTFKKRELNYHDHINFLLSNGNSLSVKTNIKGFKQAPNVVGQPGDTTFTHHFNHLFEGKISKEKFKELVLNKADLMLPIYLDFFFLNDFFLWVYVERNMVKIELYKNDDFPDYLWDKEKIKFTKSLENWVESNTLIYDEIPIGEFQVHKNRAGYKFRFHLKNLFYLLQSISKTNETLGITAEKVICDLFKLNYPLHLFKRSNKQYEKQLLSALKSTLNAIPAPIKYTGSEIGDRGQSSKSKQDFFLNNNKTLSLKTNWGKMVCPPEVGQPSKKTFILYFQHLFENQEFDNILFKNICLHKTSEMFEIYLKHLFDCDYLLWLYHEKKSNKFLCKVIDTASIIHFKWAQNKFSFSQNLETWKESCSIKYDGISIGSFQIHNHRNSYKFRFNMPNLLGYLTNT